MKFLNFGLAPRPRSVHWSGYYCRLMAAPAVSIIVLTLTVDDLA